MASAVEKLRLQLSRLPRSRSWLRFSVIGGAGLAAVLAFALFAYELALAQVPEHRAALERLVRAQTGLDVRFAELGLRWGWYGPEAAFRNVELDEPGSSEALLRAPELVVGFDAWRTLRSGHPEAGRIELVAPDIDLAGGASRGGVAGVSRTDARARAGEAAGTGASGTAGAGSGPDGAGAATNSHAFSLNRVALLQHWRGGRIDIDGGTLRLPDPSGGSNALTLQLRQASLRRSDDEWSVVGQLFLPEGVGRTARVVLRAAGDLAKPDALSGSLRLEAQRLLFPGCRDLLAGVPDLARYLPRGGNGDVTFDLDFERGRISKVAGNVKAARLVFDAPGEAASEYRSAHSNTLALSRLRGDWRVVRREGGWHFQIDSLELAKGARPASLSVDVGRSGAVRGILEQAPVDSVVAVARWLSPNLDLAGTELEGVARNVTFDWSPARPAGRRLQAAAYLEDVSLEPQSHDFTLSGLGVRVSGDETQLTVDVQSHAARLELAQSRQYPLGDVRVSSTLSVSGTPAGWRIATDEFVLEHQHAVLSLSGELHGAAPGSEAPAAAAEPEIVARGKLTGADIPFVERLLGANTAQAFGAVASRLTAGRIQNAQFELRGPISELPFGGRGGFTGSLSLKDAVLSGGDLWPDAQGIDARIEWHGARIQANIDSGHAGPFQLASAAAQWDADGQGATRLTGNINGRLEEAIAWIHDHPRLQDFTPDVKDMDASGNAAFYFNVSVPPTADDSAQPEVTARVSTVLDGVSVLAVAGLPPIQGVQGSFVFDAGHVQKTTLTGTWLGGPVTLRLGERREKGARVLAVQAQGSLKAQQLAALANAAGTVQGNTDWTGELVYAPAAEEQPAHWRMRADSSLVGLISSLPEPLAKRAALPVPLHVDVAGTDESAQMRVSMSDRVRGLFALKKRTDVGWAVAKGALRFGASAATMPNEPVLTIRGRINQLDLPAYTVAWQRLRQDWLPTIRVQMVADRMLVAGRSYDEVALQAQRTATTNELRVDSPEIAGVARWPGSEKSARGAAAEGPPEPAELRLSRLDLSDDTLPSESVGLIAGLAPTALVSVDDLRWRGRSLGRFTATVAAQNNILAVEDIRLVSATHEVGGKLHCQTESPTCLLSFRVDSSDIAATLEDFGFTPELAAEAGFLSGDVQWQPVAEQSWLASLHGTLSLRMSDGTLLASPERASDYHPFALLSVPALVDALNEPNAASASLTRPNEDLRFASLAADFDVLEGQATTSNLHFDGDAEILMRGRTGLVSRDYDQQVWVLRGQERLPAAVRRIGATPRVAAVWLSLRDLISGGDDPERAAAVLRLQGSWNAPIVVAAK